MSSAGIPNVSTRFAPRIIWRMRQLIWPLFCVSSCMIHGLYHVGNRVARTSAHAHTLAHAQKSFGAPLRFRLHIRHWPLTVPMLTPRRVLLLRASVQPAEPPLSGPWSLPSAGASLGPVANGDPLAALIMPVPAERCHSAASACLVPPAPINTHQPGVATSLLYSGSQFRGYQKSKGNAYDVEVVVQVKLQFAVG